MKRSFLTAVIGLVIACFSVPASADSGAYILPSIPANAQITISLGGSADQAVTLPWAVALGEDSITIYPADVKPMIGGADVLAFSNPIAGIDAGSSNKETTCKSCAASASAAFEVGWRNSYNA